MAKFKSKKKFNNFFIYLALFLVSSALTIKYLFQENLVNKNTIIDILISDNLGSFKSNISDVDFLLKYALNVDLEKDNSIPSSSSNNDIKEVEVNKEEIKEESTEPIVYIYNTHQEEKYQSASLAPYNINPNVLMASKMLREYLKDEGINALVEEGDIAQMLHSMNLSYGKSYQVSRMLMESAKEAHESLTYFIDLHRDSSKYEKTTTTINNENYAKLLFVVGLDNANYEPNLKLAENLAQRIKAYDESLYRGLMKKSGKGVNGVYNQDFSPKVMLIEVGGQYNSISEVNNTLKVLATILKDFIKEDQNV